MYIPAFWVGVATTILVELALVVCFAIVGVIIENKKKK